MDRCAAMYDLTTAGEQFEEPEDSSSMNDADIPDITHFRALDSDAASAEPESSGVRGGAIGRADIPRRHHRS
eukprot:2236145-Alexandrium_andersonii.AAC.1